MIDMVAENWDLILLFIILGACLFMAGRYFRD